MADNHQSLETLIVDMYERIISHDIVRFEDLVTYPLIHQSKQLLCY